MHIIIRGPMASGKTTIAKRLAKKLNAQYLSVDKILDQNNLTSDKEEGYISQKSFLAANKIIAQNIKKSDNMVIIEGNFYWQSQIDNIINSLNSNCLILTLNVSLDTCIKRDSLRSFSIGKDAVEAVYRKSITVSAGTIVNNNSSTDDCIARLLELIKLAS